MPVTLFVYGTLMRGECRHGVLAGQTFLGTARTAPDYRLYDAGGYPALVESPCGVAIDGELWQIDDRCLARVDDIEGVAEGLYERRSIRIAGRFANVPAHSYFYRRSIDRFPDCGPRWNTRPSSTEQQDGGSAVAPC